MEKIDTTLVNKAIRASNIAVRIAKLIDDEAQGHEPDWVAFVEWLLKTCNFTFTEVQILFSVIGKDIRHTFIRQMLEQNNTHANAFNNLIATMMILNHDDKLNNTWAPVNIANQ